MTNSNPNFTRSDNFAAHQRGSFNQRQFRSRQRGVALAAARPKQRKLAATYFEVLWSLPARKTLPELLQAAS
jgi:hypothetical protein